jgi:predicted transcriptional regulator
MIRILSECSHVAKEDTRMEKEEMKDVFLEAMAASLDAQLRAVRRLRSGGEAEKPRVRRRSQIDLVYDILLEAGRPLHVTEIIKRVEKAHGVSLDRESIVSALCKKVARKQRFVRTDRNTYALKGGKGDVD